MIKYDIWKLVETAVGILEKYVIETDHKGIDNRAITDALRVLREIPEEVPKDAPDPDA